MQRRLWIAAAMAVGTLIAAGGASAKEPVRLTKPASAAAFPRIAAPLTPATAKINAALARLDHRWSAFVRECKAGGKDNSADRSVAVTMAGPRFLSVVARDEESCGGAHPDTSTLALVYDLDAGRPVDWKALLGPKLVAETSTDTVIDGSTIGIVSSPALRALYGRGTRDRDCYDATVDPGLHFVAWLNAWRRAVMVEPVLPHVVAACGGETAVDLGELGRSGADPALIAALAGG